MKGYWTILTTVFLVAVVASFFVEPVNSKFVLPSVFAGGNHDSISLQTLNSNTNFMAPRPDNALAPKDWYFDSTGVGTFPFLQNGDITPWDTSQVYINSTGILLSNADYRINIFTKTYSLSDLGMNFSSQHIRVTFSYFVPDGISFVSGASINLYYSADGNTGSAVGTAIGWDGRSPEQATCSDDATLPIWKACAVSVSRPDANHVAFVVDSYPTATNMKYLGLLFHPGASMGSSGATVEKLKLEGLMQQKDNNKDRESNKYDICSRSLNLKKCREDIDKKG